MSQKLFESDFLTTDITAMFKKAQDNKDTDSKDPSSAKEAEGEIATTSEPEQKPGKIDWETELKKRIDDNKSLDKAAQVPEYEIESKFFNEYFTANWESEYVKPLILLGEPLRKIIKTLGFGKKTNPIVGFLTLKYVKENLLGPGLINSNTFKALFNAVAKKLVADSEFLRVSDYNIIYCKALYKKTAAEIEEYLALQKDILKPTASVYTQENQLRNKKVFIYLNSIKEKDNEKRALEIKGLSNVKLPSVKNATLNDIKLARKISGEAVENVSELSSQEQIKVADKLKTISQIFAAIQYLSINTKSTKAQRALATEHFKSLSTDQILKATAWLATQDIMPRVQLKTEQADALVEILLGKLQS
jgi:hypothetical protein